jgi:MFS family permease
LARYWCGQATSTFGSVFTAIALPVVAVVYLRASPAGVALISAASMFPTLLFGLPAGMLADRIIRPRRTLMTLDAVSALAVGVVALGLANHVASLAWLVTLGLVEGCVSILIEVVYFVHLRQVTGAGTVTVARARLQAGEFAAGFVGRLLAGPTIVALGASAALGVDAVSYLLSAVALLSMSPVAPVQRQPASKTETLRGALTGLRTFAEDSYRRALLICILAPAWALAGASALTAPFLLRVAHVPTAAYGLAFAISGLMGLAGSAVSGRVLGSGRNPQLVAVVALASAMACSLLLPLSAGPLPVVLPVAALGIGLPVLFVAIANIALSAVFTADIPEAVLGRVLAAVQVFAASAALLGVLAGGALGDWNGARDALWVMDASGLGMIGLLLPAAVKAGILRGRESALPPTRLAAPHVDSASLD